MAEHIPPAIQENFHEVVCYKDIQITGILPQGGGAGGQAVAGQAVKNGAAVGAQAPVFHPQAVAAHIPGLPAAQGALQPHRFVFGQRRQALRRLGEAGRDVGMYGEAELPVPPFHQPGQAHHAAPGGAAVGGILHRAGHPHPADKHPASRLVQRGLGGIEVQPPVHHGGGALQGQAAGGFVKVHRHPGGLIGVLQPVRRDAHGGTQQHPAPVQAEQVGAFQRGAQGGISEPPGASPGQAVGAAVEQQLAHPFPGAAQYHPETAVRRPPDLGVPGVLRVPRLRRGGYRQHLLFGVQIVEGDPVRGDHQRLAGLEPVVQGPVNVVGIFLIVADGGVIEVKRPGHLHRAAGKHPVAVVGFAGIEGDAPVFPVDQIVADGMAPVHGAPAGQVGEVLVKQMVPAFIINEAVGVVDPVPRRFQMQKIVQQNGPFLSDAPKHPGPCSHWPQGAGVVCQNSTSMPS